MDSIELPLKAGFRPSVGRTVDFTNPFVEHEMPWYVIIGLFSGCGSFTVPAWEYSITICP